VTLTSCFCSLSRSRLHLVHAANSFFDMQATFECLLKTYGFLTPDLWRETRFSKSPFQEFTDFLAKPHKISVLEDVEKTPVY
jgi:hypothetical protein